MMTAMMPEKAVPAAPDQRPAVPRVRFRPYFALVTGLISVGGAAMAVAVALGFSERSALPYFAGALGLGGLGLLAWGVVVWSRRSSTNAPGLAWLAFPLAVFSLLGMVPLLVIAVIPETLGILGPPDQISAGWEGRALRIDFPRRVGGRAINLKLDDTPVPARYFQEHPGRARFRDEEGPRGRTSLLLDLEAIRSDLRLGPVHRLALNEVLDGSPQILDESGKRFQPQSLEVPAAAGPR
jgi:hypothetical protein